MVFVWLDSPDLSVQRVRKRVERGGHHIPEEDVRRRYGRGLVNFFETYTKLCDHWMLVDNTNEDPEIVARGSDRVDFTVLNQELWNEIMYQYNVYKIRDRRPE